MNYYKQSQRYFLQAAKIIFAQSGDPELDSPNIIINPSEPLVQKAVDLIKSKDPNFFKGVRKIVIGEEANYGHVESGPGKDPAVIHLNYPRINREIRAKMQGASNDDIASEIAKALAATIAHERGHVLDYDPKVGFPGGESKAEQAEKELLSKLK